MRVGVVSPNILNDMTEHEAFCDYPNGPWPFDSLAKRASLLFDKIYLTDNLDLTCEIVGGGSAICNEDPNCGTLQYLAQKGLILLPQDLGYASGETFLKENIKGATARIHRQLLNVGNPSNNCGPGEYTYVGQSDIGDLEAHDGNHPRSSKGWNDPQIEIMKRKYESLLLRRNAAMLRHAGVTEAIIVGRFYEEKNETKYTHPVWKVVINEMADFDVRAPWEDVFDFRAEDRTQHFVRSLRRWIRKIVAEDWAQAELEDEVRELVYEYESHLRMARLTGGKGVLTCIITGAAELAEDVIKLRLAKITELVTAVIDRKSKLLEPELRAPGRELALIPELKERFLC
jgi:hypothetical protein